MQGLLEQAMQSWGWMKVMPKLCKHMREESWVEQAVKWSGEQGLAGGEEHSSFEHVGDALVELCKASITKRG